jgi:glycosyltransferase involved in cell wall biosynthesis
MRITIVTGPWLPVPAVQGGSVARMWHGLAEEFARFGHEVLVMARSFPGQARFDSRNGVIYRRAGGFSQSRSIYFDLAKDFVYAASVATRLPAADILVVNDFWLPVLAGWFRREAGLIVVNANRFPKGQYGLYLHAARVTAASRAVERAIIKQTPAITEKLRCIPNPVDTTVFGPPADGRNNRARRQILYAGRVHPEKGVHLLVAAFAATAAKHPETSLHVVGPTKTNQGGGGEGYLLELQRLATGLSVTISGPEFDVATLAKIYQEADLFCYPSLSEKGESFGVALVEAMSTGLPVVASGLECFLDFVEDGDNGLTFDHRGGNAVVALAQKLDEALDNWPRSLELGRRAHESAQRFSFDRIAKEFISDFELLLSDH